MGETMDELRKFVAPEFVFGNGAAKLAGQYARNYGAEKCLVVTDPGIIEAGWVDLVLASLHDEGVDTAVYSNIHPNPRDFEVMEGVEFYKAQHCDSIVAVGGGSPMDAAKGIGISTTNKQHVLAFEGVDMVERPAPPMICIPTTSGSSADVSQFAIISDTTRKVKIAIVSKAVVPDAALIDPVLTTTMPADLTAATGLDALTHAVEAFVSNAHSPVTDLFALNAIRLVFANLPQAMREPDNLEYRRNMALASMEAGLAFSNAILGAVHAMAHSLGGLKDLPHGECNAILLPYVMAANFDSAPDRFRKIAEALDVASEDEAATKAQVLDKVHALKRDVGVTKSLGDHGVTEAEISQLAAFALEDPCMITNPAALTKDDVERIFMQAL